MRTCTCLLFKLKAIQDPKEEGRAGCVDSDVTPGKTLHTNHAPPSAGFLLSDHLVQTGSGRVHHQIETVLIITAIFWALGLRESSSERFGPRKVSTKTKGPRKSRDPLLWLTPPDGFEPSAVCFQGSCSLFRFQDQAGISICSLVWTR